MSLVMFLALWKGASPRGRQATQGWLVEYPASKTKKEKPENDEKEIDPLFLETLQWACFQSAPREPRRWRKRWRPGTPAPLCREPPSSRASQAQQAARRSEVGCISPLNPHHLLGDQGHPQWTDRRSRHAAQ